MFLRNLALRTAFQPCLLPTYRIWFTFCCKAHAIPIKPLFISGCMLVSSLRIPAYLAEAYIKAFKSAIVLGNPFFSCFTIFILKAMSILLFQVISNLPAERRKRVSSTGNSDFNAIMSDIEAVMEDGEKGSHIILGGDFKACVCSCDTLSDNLLTSNLSSARQAKYLVVYARRIILCSSVYSGILFCNIDTINEQSIEKKDWSIIIWAF